MELVALLLGLACALPQFIETTLNSFWYGIFFINRLPLLRFVLLGFIVGVWLFTGGGESLRVYSNQTVTVTGMIADIPRQSLKKTQCHLALKQINGKKSKARLLLFWYHPRQQLKAGDFIQAQVKLKFARNFSNPGVFNYKRWLYSKRLDATAYVKNNQLQVKKINPSLNSYVLRIRQRIAEKIKGLDFSDQTKAIVSALTIGVKNSLPLETVQLLRHTGTSHLLAISGLHVGLIAAMAYGLVYFIWCQKSSWCLFLPAQRVGALGAVTVAFLYAMLAGFSIPTQRALIMVVCFLGRYWINFNLSVWDAWKISLLMVVLGEPNSLLMPGFYLSFAAVAVLLLARHWITQTGIKRTFFIQLACVLGLAPMTLYWFSYASLNAVLSNLIAIPVVSFFLVPLALMSVLLLNTSLVNYLFLIIEWLLKPLFLSLQAIQSLSILTLPFKVIFLWQLILAYFVLFGFFLLPHARLKAVVLFCCLPLLIHQSKTLKSGEASVAVFDVGQGLAVSVRTRNHHLLYDTGTRFYGGSDMAQLVILPVLRFWDVNRIDKLVVSHTDIDHRGGLKSLFNSIQIKEFIVNDVDYYRDKFSLKPHSCHDFPDWEWDGVWFHFIPIRGVGLKSNDSSCVLKISNRKHSALLTGDIEAKSERYLVAQKQQSLTAEFISIPHHGSRTSSSNAFIKRVNPRYGVISAGFNNRYLLPHKKVLATYLSLGVTLYNTAYCGMATWNLTTTYSTNQPRCYLKN